MISPGKAWRRVFQQLRLGSRIRIDRGEISGAFGDIGTDLPLLTGMILASGMNPASVLTVFGLVQVASAVFYGIPMPVQPLKAVAALAIAGGIAAPQIFGGRTGGSVLLYGLVLLTFGLFFGSGFGRMVHVFPLPVLGVILITEGCMLMRFVRDLAPDRFSLAVAVVTALSAVLLPCGFLVGMAAGTCMAYMPQVWLRVKSQLARVPDSSSESI